MRVQFRADMAPLESALDRAAADAAGIIEAGMETTAAGVTATVVPIIAAETPHITSDLANSTGARVFPSPDGTLIEFYQDAESKPNWDGSGGGFHYMQSVWHGRKAISVADRGPFSTGKMALRTPWGPRKSVGASTPNDYPERAMATAAGPIAFVLRDAAKAMALRIAAGLGGTR